MRYCRILVKSQNQLKNLSSILGKEESYVQAPSFKELIIAISKVVSDESKKDKVNSFLNAVKTDVIDQALIDYLESDNTEVEMVKMLIPYVSDTNVKVKKSTFLGKVVQKSLNSRGRG